MKVTLNDIATKLGVHVSTISLALNNSPKIPKTTRELVRKAAEELGYQTNPYVAALMSSIRSGKTPESPPTIAFITASESQHDWQKNYNFSQFHDSCKSVAQSLGMRSETFWLGDKNMSPKRLDEILYNRGIQGGIFLPTGKLREKMNYHWDRIAAVSYGIYDISPSIDRVKADHYGNMEKVFNVMAELNLKRVGFVMETPYPYQNQNRWLASYLMEQRILPDDRKIEPLLDPAPTFETFKTWFRKTNPDVILCVHIPKVAGWLEKLGLAFPQNVSLVTVGNAHDDPSYSDIIEESPTCGQLAIETLLDRIHRNQIGPPKAPRFITVQGRWQDGSTATQAT